MPHFCYYADLHVHSHHSYATSASCTLESLTHWAQLKGINVCGTGDCTHPLWLAELRAKLIEDAPGLYALKPALLDTVAPVPDSCRAPVRFMVTGEVSSIYTRGGKTRKVHSLLMLPSLETAERLNARLAAIGNLASDGRPVLGLDPRDLLSIMLETDPRAVLIPAHIWTPWFSMLGAKSGFDSLAECFGDLSPHIFAVETGLSSDAPMNHRISFLQDTALISNSDLHSPEKLGRNANIFFREQSFDSMMTGLRLRMPSICGGTIDLFPEEGKYHHDGHRACGVRLPPEDSMLRDSICPACGKPLTMGVLHRVLELERLLGGPAFPPASIRRRRLPHRYIIPLPELIANRLGLTTTTGKKVTDAYHRTLARFGPEIPLLIDATRTTLRALDDLGRDIISVREGRVTRESGYDGVYGIIRPA